MRFDIVTIFPGFFASVFQEGVVAKARDAGKLGIFVHDLRHWTYDRHRTVDDRPFGGGEGMVLKPDPLFKAVESIVPDRSARTRVVLLSPAGQRFDEGEARRLASCSQIVLICGRYEGVDERVSEHLVDQELSIGDYVLSGGELGAAVIIDAVGRLVADVLGNQNSSENESFSEGSGHLLDCPHYTRPAEFRQWKVPDVLLSGNHAEIKRWRQEASLAKTRRLRPDLLASRNRI